MTAKKNLPDFDVGYLDAFFKRRSTFQSYTGENQEKEEAERR